MEIWLSSPFGDSLGTIPNLESVNWISRFRDVGTVEVKYTVPTEQVDVVWNLTNRWARGYEIPLDPAANPVSFMMLSRSRPTYRGANPQDRRFYVEDPFLIDSVAYDFEGGACHISIKASSTERVLEQRTSNEHLSYNIYDPKLGNNRRMTMREMLDTVVYANYRATTYPYRQIPVAYTTLAAPKSPEVPMGFQVEGKTGLELHRAVLDSTPTLGIDKRWARTTATLEGVTVHDVNGNTPLSYQWQYTGARVSSRALKVDLATHPLVERFSVLEQSASVPNAFMVHGEPRSRASETAPGDYRIGHVQTDGVSGVFVIEKKIDMAQEYPFSGAPNELTYERGLQAFGRMARQRSSEDAYVLSVDLRYEALDDHPSLGDGVQFVYKGKHLSYAYVDEIQTTFSTSEGEKTVHKFRMVKNAN